MQSSRSSQSTFGLTLVMMAIALITPSLTGCTAGLYAAQLIPTGIVAYQYLPGDSSVELDKPGRGIRNSSIGNIKSILTDNVYAAEYLQNEKLFSKVTLTKKAPLSLAGAASTARQQGYDGFFMVDFRGPTLRDGIVMKIDYGSATVRLVTKDGTLVYEQTATLTGKANSPENPTERQVAEALSLSLLSDLEQSMGAKTAVSTDGHKEENMVDKAVNKVKGWLN